MLTRVQVQCCFGVALLLLCCSYLPITRAAQPVDMNDICRLVQNGVMLRDPNNCIIYYSCYNGTATRQVCANGGIFNKNTQNCAQSALCLNDGNGPCVGQMIGTYLPVPGSCNRYYYCSYNGALLAQCQTGFNYDPDTHTCSNSYPCVPGPTNGAPQNINLCNYMPNATYFASPTSCAGWNICYNNNMQSGMCSTGLIYNVQMARCDYPANTSCMQVSVNSDLVPSDAIDGGNCTAVNATKAAVSCNLYYVCNGINYALMKCPNDLYYDIVSGECVNRMNARNNCDRCQGTSSQFVNKYSEYSCVGFLYCRNGIAQSAGYCEQNLVFNELVGGCVQGQQPDFGCCNPAYNATASVTPDTA